ncbi:carbonic anhydrase [Phytohabitans aurantiacus]|uniref:carbonic anhydrase n=1 Tax=Phytohabitans aurantiacus TaxID=3016789 RepID=A0ABQ5QN39_9ACTN|nr:carbonic anhydrase [Phytohabitans aurantiacus]GLH96101.1 carbonic anhydrase [Phytohabitans aurantiacus]
MQHRAVQRRALLAASGLVAGAVGLAARPTAASAATATEPIPETPAAAIHRLLNGNHRFITGHSRHPHQSLNRLHELAAGQDPFVITLGCADSRVAPEVLFDQGLGDIFDNRVAGNIVDDLLFGSVEYAVEHFAPPLLLVLGHERCGAVSATVEVIESGGTAPGHIGAIVEALRPIITPVLENAGDKVENGVVANIKAQVKALVEGSDIVREKVEADEMAVVGARYDLDTGKVTLVH